MEEIFASLLDWVCLGRTRYSTFLRVYKRVLGRGPALSVEIHEARQASN